MSLGNWKLIIFQFVSRKLSPVCHTCPEFGGVRGPPACPSKVSSGEQQQKEQPRAQKEGPPRPDSQACPEGTLFKRALDSPRNPSRGPSGHKSPLEMLGFSQFNCFLRACIYLWALGIGQETQGRRDKRGPDRHLSSSVK